MKKVLALGIILLLLPLSNVLAEQCRADADCDTKVGLSDLVIMKSEFLKTGCEPCMCDPAYECPAGMVNCGGMCVDPLKDRNYCGADSNCIGGTVCGDGQRCDNGICTLTCQSGLTECGGMCVDIQTNENHCGGCDSPCDSGKICIAGNCEIYSSDNYAPVPKSGAAISCAAGDDGDLQKGVAWPNPRFTDNGDGTVTDNMTGLIWLKNANCFGQRTWNEAISDCNNLASGACGLTDFSVAGDWRLPNMRELQSLVHYGYWDPTLPNTAGTGQWVEDDPFTSVQPTYYWTSTTLARVNTIAGYVLFGNGSSDYSYKTLSYHVWPVRGPQ